MRIKKLQPTHKDSREQMMSYAFYEGKWWFVLPFSFDGESYDWAESSPYEKDLNLVKLRTMSK